VLYALLSDILSLRVSSRPLVDAVVASKLNDAVAASIRKGLIAQCCLSRWIAAVSVSWTAFIGIAVRPDT
jgi:hypothetical protein